MDTSVIRAGDIIRVDDGLQWYAVVSDTKPLRAQIIGGTKGLQRPRPVKSRHVIGHWRKSTATKRREVARVE